MPYFNRRVCISAGAILLAGCQFSSLWTYRQGTLQDAIDPQCVETGLRQMSGIEKLKHETDRHFINGRPIIKHDFAYEVKGGGSSKLFRIIITDGRTTNFYHQLSLPSKTPDLETKQKLEAEGQQMIEVEKLIGAACHIPNIEEIIKPNVGV